MKFSSDVFLSELAPITDIKKEINHYLDNPIASPSLEEALQLANAEISNHNII